MKQEFFNITLVKTEDFIRDNSVKIIWASHKNARPIF